MTTRSDHVTIQFHTVFWNPVRRCLAYDRTNAFVPRNGICLRHHFKDIHGILNLRQVAAVAFCEFRYTLYWACCVRQCSRPLARNKMLPVLNILKGVTLNARTASVVYKDAIKNVHYFYCTLAPMWSKTKNLYPMFVALREDARLGCSGWFDSDWYCTLCNKYPWHGQSLKCCISS